MTNLKTNYDDESTLKEIGSFENETKVSLPIFKASILNFDIHSISEFEMFKITLQDNSYINFNEGGFQHNPEVDIEKMLRPNEFKNAKQNVYHYEEDQEIVKNKIVVGNIYGRCLLLGIDDQNIDNLFADRISLLRRKTQSIIATF